MIGDDWVRAWFGRKAGKEFVQKHALWGAQLKGELEKGLQRSKREGPGSCTCGGGLHALAAENSFYLERAKKTFIRICSDCDSWAVFRSQLTTED